MHEQEQGQVLSRVVTDIQERVGCKVDLNLRSDDNGSKRKFKLQIPASHHRKSKVFGYATIKPVKGCLSFGVWEKDLKNADKSKMLHWEFVQRLHWNEDGRRLWYCEDNDALYRELVYGFSMAYICNLQR